MVRGWGHRKIEGQSQFDHPATVMGKREPLRPTHHLFLPRRPILLPCPLLEHRRGPGRGCPEAQVPISLTPSHAGGKYLAQRHTGTILGDPRICDLKLPAYGQGVPAEPGHHCQPVPILSILLLAGGWWRAGVAGLWP